jgi:hypothetical protein
MKRILLTAVAAAAFATFPASAFAGSGGQQSPLEALLSLFTPTPSELLGPPEGQTGQLFAECVDDGPTPGHAADATGSAFHEGGTAGQHYAGEQPQNSKNNASVSQYDTACVHNQSQH